MPRNCVWVCPSYPLAFYSLLGRLLAAAIGGLLQSVVGGLGCLPRGLLGLPRHLAVRPVDLHHPLLVDAGAPAAWQAAEPDHAIAVAAVRHVRGALARPPTAALRLVNRRRRVALSLARRWLLCVCQVISRSSLVGCAPKDGGRNLYRLPTRRPGRP